MTTKDFLYLLMAIVVFCCTHQDWKDEDIWNDYIDHMFFLGERE